MFDRPKFDSEAVWQALLREEDPFTVFMAVPTIYNTLTRYLNEGKMDVNREQIRESLSKYRLMVSGSAALPEA